MVTAELGSSVASLINLCDIWTTVSWLLLHRLHYVRVSFELLSTKVRESLWTFSGERHKEMFRFTFLSTESPTTKTEFSYFLCRKTIHRSAIWHFGKGTLLRHDWCHFHILAINKKLKPEGKQQPYVSLSVESFNCVSTKLPKTLFRYKVNQQYEMP